MAQAQVSDAVFSMLATQAAAAGQAKPDAKPAKGKGPQRITSAAKGKGGTKGKGKPDTKPASAPAKASPAGSVRFAIRDSFRPSAGGLLFAYTMAWIEGTGLANGGSIPRADAVKLAGATAIGYHVNSTGRLIDNKGSVSLAPDALAFFQKRQHTQADKDAYLAILTTGEPDGVKAKSRAGIAPLKDETKKA